MTDTTMTEVVGENAFGCKYAFRINEGVVEFRQLSRYLSINSQWYALALADWPELTASELRAIATLREG